MFKTLCAILLSLVSLAVPTTDVVEVTGYQDPGGRLIVHYVDLDNDCAFIELPNGESMLVNSGGEKTADYIEDLGYAYVDYIIITAADDEHMLGLDEVVKRFGISKVYMPYELNTHSETLINTLKENGLVPAFANGNTQVKKVYNLKVEIFAPDDDSLNDIYTTRQITFENTTLVFEGEKYAKQAFWSVFE